MSSFVHKYRFLIISQLIILLFFHRAVEYTPLPGLDTPGHFYALSRMANDLLPHGRIAGYDLGWFGGITLFKFYPPLMFVIISLVYHAFLQTMQLFYVFRFFAFVNVIAFPLIFYMLLKTFYNEKVANDGVLLSLFFVFYPRLYGFIGMGAASVFWGGLIPAFFGLNILLIFINSLKVLKNKFTVNNYLFSTLTLVFLILSHTLSLIAGVLSAGVYLMVNRKKPFPKVFLLVFITSFLVSAFWWLPFLAGLKYASGETSGITSLIGDPFIILFPIDFGLLGNLTVAFIKLNWWAIFLLPMTVFGIYRLVKEKDYFFLTLFGIMYLFVTRNIFPLVTGFSVHYQRFLPFLFVLMLILASKGFHHFLSVTLCQRKLLPYVFIGCLLIQTTAYYDFSGMVGFRGDRDSLSSIPTKWSWSDYPLNSELINLMAAIKKEKDVSKVYLEIPPDIAVLDVGSTHYFSSNLPIITGNNVINGLYSESSPLTPYIMPVLDALTLNTAQTWGDVRLRDVGAFYKQSFNDYLKRLGYLGVSHIASYSPEIRSLLEVSGAKKLYSSEHFVLFRLPYSKPLLYEETYLPGVVIIDNERIDFRDISMALYSSPLTFDQPVVLYESSIASFLSSKIKDEAVFIILLTTDPNRSAKLSSALEKPVYTLNKNNFEIIPKNGEAGYRNTPYGWENLITFVKANKHSRNVTDSLVDNWRISNEEITVPVNSLTHVNIGYAREWQIDKNSKCELFRVTPDQIMVFNKNLGVCKLKYGSLPINKISEAISILGFVLLLTLFLGKTRRWLLSVAGGQGLEPQ